MTIWHFHQKEFLENTDNRQTDDTKNYKVCTRSCTQNKKLSNNDNSNLYNEQLLSYFLFNTKLFTPHPLWGTWTHKSSSLCGLLFHHNLHRGCSSAFASASIRGCWVLTRQRLVEDRNARSARRVEHFCHSEDVFVSITTAVWYKYYIWTSLEEILFCNRNVLVRSYSLRNLLPSISETVGGL